MVTLASIPLNLRRAPPTWQAAAANLIGRKITVLQCDNLGWNDGREIMGKAFKYNGKPVVIVRTLGYPWEIGEVFIHECSHHKHPLTDLSQKASGGWRFTYQTDQEMQKRREEAVDACAKRIIREIRRLWNKIPHDRSEWWHGFTTPQRWRGLVVLEEIMELIAEADL